VLEVFGGVWKFRCTLIIFSENLKKKNGKIAKIAKITKNLSGTKLGNAPLKKLQKIKRKLICGNFP
jgi:hypothetical protein